MLVLAAVGAATVGGDVVMWLALVPLLFAALVTVGVWVGFLVRRARERERKADREDETAQAMRETELVEVRRAEGAPPTEVLELRPAEPERASDPEAPPK